MRYLNHEVDLCVVGGGLAGFCTAVAAARHGIKVALMQDRPVLGGNASSEIRMWICGANGKYDRETGICEGLFLENYYRNPNLSYSIWDSVLYGIAVNEPNLKLFLNCTCQKAEMDDNKIVSVTGWQLTNETYNTIKAKYFADCSGDSILAPLTGAQFMMGREGKSEFNESIEPDIADTKTMGQSCMMQLREYPEKQEFIPPVWANKYPTDADLPSERGHFLDKGQNFWWLEVGGDRDTLHGAEEFRDELLKIVFGLWDHIKNYGDHGADNWAIDWVGFLPGKRESRRYVGDYIMCQNDVETGGKFDDTVAYGGWTMDDHKPLGIYYQGEPTTFHPAPSPYGIPFRCLYSKNIENLCFAGRNISVTHAAMSSTRVMATCAVLGQALGTAVAQAVNDGVELRNIDVNKLQQTLLYDDCFIPGVERKVPTLTLEAETNAPVLTNGKDRAREDNCKDKYICKKGDEIYFKFKIPHNITEIKIIFDSCLEREYDNMPCRYSLKEENYKVPKTLVKSYKIYADTEDGKILIANTECNYQRMVKHIVNLKTEKITIVPLETWGDENIKIYLVEME